MRQGQGQARGRGASEWEGRPQRREGGSQERGPEQRASHCQGAAGRARGGGCSGVRRLCILAGHQQGAGACTRGHTDCVQEGAGPEEVLWRVDDGVADGVEHLDGWVSPHGARRGACMEATLLKNASSLKFHSFFPRHLSVRGLITLVANKHEDRAMAFDT